MYSERALFRKKHGRCLNQIQLQPIRYKLLHVMMNVLVVVSLLGTVIVSLLAAVKQ